MRFFKDLQYTAFPPDANTLQPANIAHLYYGEVLYKHTNWTLIEGLFTVTKDHNWVAISNFFWQIKLKLRYLILKDTVRASTTSRVFE